MLSDSWRLFVKLTAAGWLLVCVGDKLFAANLAAISAHLGSYDTNGGFSAADNVFMTVTDPSGRETGYDPFLNVWKEEIPGSSSSSETVDDDETGQKGPADFTLYIAEDPTSGEYVYSVYALRDVMCLLELNIDKENGARTHYKFQSYVASGTVSLYNLQYDPAPAAAVPVVTKVVTFDTLRRDILVTFKLNQLGDDKFVKDLGNNIGLAEKLYAVCEKRSADKQKGCEPAVNALRLFVKRLELANKKCDDPAACDEGPLWEEFRKKHGKDRDYDEFFKEHDKEERGKAKDKPKRFVTDEALAIIKGDAEILMAKLAGEKSEGPAPEKKKGDKR